jgi:peptidoglycan L-alanyl-D-glutamate endopeptidase CwlK
VSRSLDDLEPGTRAKVVDWVARCKARGVDILVYCTARSHLEQEELFRQGRTTPGKIVTNAAPWQSWHQYGRAVDAVPLFHGKPLWRYNQFQYEWQVFAAEAELAGLEWAGRWRTFKEYVHVQSTGGMTLAQAYKAVRPEADNGIS